MRIFDNLYKYCLYLRYKYWNWKDVEKRTFLRNLKIMTPEKTIQYIIDHKCNVSRYGDGEFYVMAGGSNGFQEKNQKLAKRLQDILKSKDEGIFLCIPQNLYSSKRFVLYSRLFSEAFKYTNLKTSVIPFVDINYLYGDSEFTRFYIRNKDKNRIKIQRYIDSIRRIWESKNVLFVEGKFTKCGVGNDLFNNADSIQRIICPSENAFDKYDEILQAIKINASGKLVLLALGMTATVLAHDLLKYGIWAIDLGHIDIEYEWYRMGVKKKVPIKGKYVNEIPNKKMFLTENNDSEYLEQIIRVIE